MICTESEIMNWSWDISLPRRSSFLQNVCSSVFSASAESASLKGSTQLLGINVPAREGILGWEKTLKFWHTVFERTVYYGISQAQCSKKLFTCFIRHALKKPLVAYQKLVPAPIVVKCKSLYLPTIFTPSPVRSRTTCIFELCPVFAANTFSTRAQTLSTEPANTLYVRRRSPTSQSRPNVTFLQLPRLSRNVPVRLGNNQGLNVL